MWLCYHSLSTQEDVEGMQFGQERSVNVVKIANGLIVKEICIAKDKPSCLHWEARFPLWKPQLEKMQIHLKGEPEPRMLPQGFPAGNPPPHPYSPTTPHTPRNVFLQEATKAHTGHRTHEADSWGIETPNYGGFCKWTENILTLWNGQEPVEARRRSMTIWMWIVPTGLWVLTLGP